MSWELCFELWKYGDSSAVKSFGLWPLSFGHVYIYRNCEVLLRFCTWSVILPGDEVKCSSLNTKAILGATFMGVLPTEYGVRIILFNKN